MIMTDQYANQWNSEERSKACFDEKQSSCKEKNTPTKKKKKIIFGISVSYLNFLVQTINTTLNQSQCFIVQPEMKVSSSITL